MCDVFERKDMISKKLENIIYMNLILQLKSVKCINKV